MTTVLDDMTLSDARLREALARRVDVAGRGGSRATVALRALIVCFVVALGSPGGRWAIFLRGQQVSPVIAALLLLATAAASLSLRPDPRREHMTNAVT